LHDLTELPDRAFVDESLGSSSDTILLQSSPH